MTSDILQLVVGSLVISLVTFGGGSLPLFYQFGVEQTHWLTGNDLSSVIAFGYATPGPSVFGAATFIGYKVAGVPGAIVGTASIFVVPFMASVIAAKYFSRLLDHVHAEMFSHGVGLAAAGLVASTAFSVMHMSHAAVWQLLVMVVSFVVCLKWKTNPLFVLLAGGILGYFLT